ncbi:hypothetical protein [Salinibaculum rarum]|uniref:hypothetical protein n=1 Tax=Salinibaculum rarum TaxID=3058903 RepID=UPI00265DD9B1|nr:hypothetical protein [Salinibaculum sp. KK48]
MRVRYATDKNGGAEVGSAHVSVAAASARSVGVHGHVAQANASRTDPASSEPPADRLWDDDDTGGVISPAAGRSVIDSPQVGQP